jgi:hypothetical protein
MRKDFYKKVLPSLGVYCVVGISKEGIPTHHFTETLDEVETLINKLEAENKNVFVNLSSLTGFSRKTDYAKAVKSFFIDLDIGNDPKKYPSKEAALIDLARFVEEKELPPPVRINSGGGVHAYWILDRDIPVHEWRMYAKKFKAVCLEHLKIDPVVTADAVRIMRAPNTHNQKFTPPVPTSFYDTDFEEWDFDMFKDFLGEVEPDTEDLLASIPRGIDDDTREIAKYNNFETSFETIVVRSLEDKGCAQIKNVIVNAATLEEPLWHSGLSIARQCVDWEESIHMMSEDYPKYDREKTIRKANETLNKPHSCETFELRNPGGCNDCPHKGRITNPLALGRHFKEAPPVPEPTEDPNVCVPVFPPALRPFVRGANGGIYYLSQKDEEDAAEPLLLWPHDLFPIKRMSSRHDGDCLVMIHSTPKDGDREFILPLKSVSAHDQLKQIMSTYGVLYDPAYSPHMHRYIKQWNLYMMQSNPAEQMRMQMGFTEDAENFVIGNLEITSSGVDRVAPASPFVRNISKLLKKEGTLEAWVAAAAQLNKPGLEQHAYTMMNGFGSVLMRLTSTSGGTLSLAGKTGTAKTGAMYGALSIWGNPKELSVFDTTDNGMVGRMLGLHNIPLGIDEASNKDGMQVSNLIHRASHGKSKIRMQNSVNAERELEFSASLIMIITTNHSMIDKVEQLKGSADGEGARIFELSMEKPTWMDNEKGREIFDTFRNNYCHAGPIFMRHYYLKGEHYVKGLIRKWAERFTKEYGSDSAYRFHENMISCSFAGAELAMEAGLINFDLDRIFLRIIRELCALRDKVQINKLDPGTVVADFLHHNQQNILILDNGRIISEPRGPLICRIEAADNIQYVSTTAFERYLSEKHISREDFEKAAKAEGLLRTRTKQRLSTGWKAGMTTPPIALYAFNIVGDVNELIKPDA